MYTFGITTDIQYANKATANGRYFSDSLEKLAEAYATFKKEKVDFWLDLGDVIDEGAEHFDPVFWYFNRFTHQKFHLIGNHDYAVMDELKDTVPKRFQLPKPYYYFTKKIEGYQLLFLDGNDISLHKSKDGTEARKTAHRYLEEAKKEGLHAANFYNGAIGPEQLKWLEKRLELGSEKGLKTIIFCHFPVLPNDTHSLWNGDDILEILWKYPTVKAWINGHNHKGDLDQANHIHFLTLKGMVQGPDNAYAIAQLSEKGLDITGFGRQEDLHLEWLQ